MNKNIPIFFACDEKFVKFTYVTLKSIMENASKNYNYKAYILITDISDEIKEAGYKMVLGSNFELEFVDVTAYLNSIKDRLPIRDYYTKTTYFRLFIAEMYPEYDKAIYIDSDTIVKGDISKLYNHELGDNLVGACNEQAMVQTDVYGTYVEKNMGLDRNKFFNAGMLVINCERFRAECVLEQFIDLLGIYNFKVTQDEDYLNVICYNRVLWIDNSWNVEVYEQIKYSEEEINMIHYIMWAKPWHFSGIRLEKFFWQYAEMTPYYAEIKAVLAAYTDEQRQKDLVQASKLAELAMEETNKEDTFIKVKHKKKSVGRLQILKKIREYELEGRFDEDVEDDPESRELQPGEVDYLRSKFTSKIKAKFAFRMAYKFVGKLQKENKFILKEIKGVEHLQNLQSGAIITCNHFNAFDSFAMHLTYDAANQKKRKFFRVIREGNYTSFPGFYGNLMRNCYTLPLSSNNKAMREFMAATNQILKDGHFILIYPEQSMWWNYRKPKPLKSGAYHFAVKNDVPVVPCFITMEDSQYLDDDGFPVQEYTVHVSKPIYPDQNRNSKENINYMMESNYEIWKNIYEESYDMPLSYN